MHLNWVFLLATSLASLAACEETKFMNPPPYALVDDDLRRFDNNQRYKQGEVVPVILSNVVDIRDLSVWQLSTAGDKKGQETRLDVTKQSQLTHSPIRGRYHWTAVYDMGHYLQNGEDAVYLFQLNQHGTLGPTLRSAFFNVSMPDSGSSKSPVASKPSRKEKNRKGKNCKNCSNCQKCQKCQHSQKCQKCQKCQNCQNGQSCKNRKGKNPKEKTPKDKKASARSGLTGGQVAGITIGAIVAFALILCGFCWGFERMRVRKQLRKSHEFELRNMERDVRSLRETVAKLGA
ncbi:hypothetical protein J7337_006190 [Fusarium musae]|uniref:Uncharacterized protein n=1 Tax=Fusarium musae TaxID=1042133 RepID=A0A9P8IS02_9HYPO|nr:hypothetical protein J7337_006190 [Fusarium musae]KAG9503345.1 hypothetical protein J7337_006190 [Fusarium musae]